MPRLALLAITAFLAQVAGADEAPPATEGEAPARVTVTADGASTTEVVDNPVFIDPEDRAPDGSPAPAEIAPWLGGWWSNESLTSELRAHFNESAGIVIIRNFLSEQAAEAVHAELLTSRERNASWSEAAFSRPGYQHRYQEWLPPAKASKEEAEAYPMVAALHWLFQRTELCKWAQAVIGSKVEFPKTTSVAKDFGPGDHMSISTGVGAMLKSGQVWSYHRQGASLPQWVNKQDTTSPSYSRRLAFHLHLTKDWEAEWGGDHVFTKPYMVIPPTFNTLIIYPVGITMPDSTTGAQIWGEMPPQHQSLITPVTHLAAQMGEPVHRFEIQGWWHTLEMPRRSMTQFHKTKKLVLEYKEELRRFALPINGTTGKQLDDVPMTRKGWWAEPQREWKTPWLGRKY